jgi:site-specific DNA-methyltransferase (adenine-specific)
VIGDIIMGKIFNKSFIDGMDDVPKDAIIITDPPYNINFKYNQYKDSMDDDDYINMIKLFEGMKCVIIQYPVETMKYLVPALGIPQTSVAWCYHSNLVGKDYRLVNFFNFKPDMKKETIPYRNPTDKRIKERITNGNAGRPLRHWWDDIEMVKNVSAEKTIHPCPIPEKLIERIINISSNEGDTIIDPFMGGGTVPTVAKRMGRNYIGFEIDKTYFEVAQQRIDGEIRQTKLLNNQ